MAGMDVNTHPASDSAALITHRVDVVRPSTAKTTASHRGLPWLVPAFEVRVIECDVGTDGLNQPRHGEPLPF